MSDVIREEVTQGDKFSAVTASVLADGSSSNTNEMPPESEKGSDAGHGNRFQSKLLMLFCIRAINAGYKFYLGTELLDQGNKFDDLIFKYSKNKNAENTEDNWPYQYLQAKSRLKEKDDKITAKDLCSVPAKGTTVNVDFSLPKYFRSYCEITRRGDKIDSCIICTNIDFANQKSLRGNGIEVTEVHLDDPILKFEKLSNEKIPTRYKIEIKEKDLSSVLKVETASKLLAKMLCAKKPLNSKSDVIRNYHMALGKENVINLITKKFHEDFINGCNELSEGAKELRHNFLKLFKNDNDWKTLILSFDKNFGKLPLQPEIFNYPLPIAVKDEEIDGFFDKLIFAVNTPNEGELDDVLKGEVGNYFKLLVSDLQSAYVMNEMVNWFKRENNVWLSSEEAKELFLNKTQTIMESIRVNEISIDYQSQLKKDLMGLEFNSDSLQDMTEKLKLLLEDSSSMVMIGTESPHHTAVKLIAAIKIHPDFKCDDSFLVTPSKRLEDEVEVNKLKNCLELKKNSHTLLIVVCDGEISVQNYMKYANLVSGRRTDDKINKVVIVCPDKTAKITDEIKYMDLTDEFKQKILSLKVSFQLKKDSGQTEMENNRITVGDLIGDKPEEVIDFSSIKELTQTGYEVKIPSFDDTTHFEENMYIKRQLKFPFHEKFEDELAKSLDCTVNKLREECRFCSDGQIEWLVEENRQKEIWKKILDVTNQSPSSDVTPEHHLIRCKENGKENSFVVIISGVAGTGKSTILSHYSREIKRAKPDFWVIKMNLVDHCEALAKSNVNQTNAVDFIVDYLHKTGNKDSFTNSLLRYRLETGDRIVVMFDGFDEINDHCQEKAIQLMKSITKEKSIQLYVTSRPHMLDNLQFQLSQLAVRLENFTEKDQIDYLASCWKKEENLSKNDDGSLTKFAKSLVDRMSKILKDEERSFIGIPLQCRMLAECFQSEVQKLALHDFDSHLNKIENQNLNLASLYRLLMEKKRDIYRQEKLKASPQSHAMDSLVDRDMKNLECYLIQLAVKTIVSKKEHAEVLLRKEARQSSFESEAEIEEKEEKLKGDCVRFGLLNVNADGKVQFLHRTYAEYFMAEYLYKGFLLDEKRHNRLLEDESAPKLIVNKILAMNQYNGVQTFFDSMLKELVDGNEEWRNRIEGRDLPERLKKFSEHFYNRFLCQDIPPKVTVSYHGTSTHSHGYDRENALHFSLFTGKKTIFTFLCDCLEATLDKKQIQMVMMKSFIYEESYFSFNFVRKTESKLFKRLIDYLDSEADTVLSKLTRFFCYLPPSNLEYSQWNGEEQKKTVHHLLQFMTEQREAFDKYFVSVKDVIIEPMLTFLIFNENYDSHLKIFLGLLSRSKDYRNDIPFIKLLKKSFCSETHFRSGRIEKALAILCGLKRNNVLSEMRSTVLNIEPEAFQRIYKPLPLVGDVTAMDFNLLIERDSFGMTCLHRAAFYGDIEGVDKILENIRQNFSQGNEIKQVANVMAQNEYGFTPFYVAAVCGKEEIFKKMLAFLKVTLPADVLEKHLLDTKGFVCRALSDAIEFENIQLFQLIVKAVKIELGQKELLQILRLSKSDIVECKTKELLKAMARTVFMKDENVSDCTDLYDFVLGYNSSIILEYIDVENLQGLLSYKGVDEFTKQLLNNTTVYPFGFRLLSDHLLRHFTKDQLEEFVETIIYKKNFRKIKMSSDVCKSDDLNDPAKAESIILSLINKRCTKEDLLFRDEGNGFTTIYTKERQVPRNSYWRDFIIKATKNNYKSSEDGLGCLNEVLCIFDCLKGGVSDDSLKKLLLHENEKGFIMIRSSIEAVKRMLIYLSEESQEEVKRKWKNEAPPMDTFFSSALKLQNISRIMRKAHHWTTIMRFYLEYGSEVHLKKFVDTITLLRNVGEEHHSVWSIIFKHGINEEKIHEILKLVSDILGRDAVKTMLLHKIDGIPLILKAMQWGIDIDARLKILPNEIREEIQQFMKMNAPTFIDEALRNLKTLFEMFVSSGRYYKKSLNALICFLNYCENQLEKFVQNITSLHLNIPSRNIVGDSVPVQQEQMLSIWGELFSYKIYYERECIAKMEQFMSIARGWQLKIWVYEDSES